MHVVCLLPERSLARSMVCSVTAAIVLHAQGAHALEHQHTHELLLAAISLQGPLPATVATFWLMVLEQRAPAIIMLTNLVERGAAKCVRYFPDQPG